MRSQTTSAWQSWRWETGGDRASRWTASRTTWLRCTSPQSPHIHVGKRERDSTPEGRRCVYLHPIWPPPGTVRFHRSSTRTRTVCTLKNINQRHMASGSRCELTIIPPKILYQAYACVKPRGDDAADKDYTDDIAGCDHVCSTGSVVDVRHLSRRWPTSRYLGQRNAFGDQGIDDCNLRLACHNFCAGFQVREGKGEFELVRVRSSI